MPPPHPPHPPGSFTKNFGWGGSLRSLHQGIRAGFAGTLAPLTRDAFRSAAMLSDTNFLITTNFFLHNVVQGTTNVIPLDEFVRQAVAEPYSRAFDRLGLFALNLSLGGQRRGVNGVEYPACWANEFVRQSLWQGGCWHSAALEEPAMDSFLSAHIQGVPQAKRKCRSNYRHMFELAGYVDSASPDINTEAATWAAPALFTAWDRRSIVAGLTTSPRPAALLATSEAEEDFKLLGIDMDEFRALAPPIADQYVSVGGLSRFAASGAAATAAPAPARRIRASSSPAPVPVAPAAPAASGSFTPAGTLSPADLSWLTTTGSDAAVERQVGQRLAQKRNQMLATRLKAHYDYKCTACGSTLLIGAKPNKHYAEAAHIKPLGMPHNGPDKAGNLLVLCPNHHLQFDRGILSLRTKRSGVHFVSRVPGDPIDGLPVPFKAPHVLDDDCVRWHADFFARVGK